MYIYSIYILHIFRCITCFFCKSLHSRNSACSTPKLLISVFMTSSINLLLDKFKNCYYFGPRYSLPPRTKKCIERNGEVRMKFWKLGQRSELTNMLVRWMKVGEPHDLKSLIF